MKRDTSDKVYGPGNLYGFLEKFVDDQSGRYIDGVENAGVYLDSDLTIRLWAYGPISEEEWLEEGQELVEILIREGYGEWKVVNPGNYTCVLIPVDVHRSSDSLAWFHDYSLEKQLKDKRADELYQEQLGEPDMIYEDHQEWHTITYGLWRGDGFVVKIPRMPNGKWSQDFEQIEDSLIQALVMCSKKPVREPRKVKNGKN